MSEKSSKPSSKSSAKSVEKTIPKVENNNEKAVKGGDRSKTLKVVQLRNRFFFMLYRYSTLVFMSSIVTFVTALSFLIFYARQPVPPQYIPVNEDGTYIKLDPLSQCKEDSEVKKFAINAIKKLYKFDYINYPDQFQEAAPYFTSDGWNKYLDSFTSSNNLQAIKENKWISTIQINSLPEIYTKKVINGVCTWELKSDVQISYIGTSGQNPKGNVYMRIVRTSVIDHPEGLGIDAEAFQPSAVSQ